MAINYRDLGIRVRTKREEKGMSQAELAEKAKLSTQHISNVENARTKIGLEKLVDVANTLNCSVDELICGSIKKGRTVYNSEIAKLIEDFSDAEIRVLPEFLKNIDHFYKLLENSIRKEEK